MFQCYFLRSSHLPFVYKSVLYICIPIAAAAAKSLQSCPTLCNPIDGSPPGSPVPGILQARTLEWVAISFSNAWKWKVKVKSLSRVRLLATPWTTAYQAPPSMGFSRQEYWSGVPLPSPASPLLPCKKVHQYHLSRLHICVNVWYLFFSFWLTSLCIIDSFTSLELTEICSFLWLSNIPSYVLYLVGSNSLRSHGIPPGSSVHGLLQARILECVAISSFRGIFLIQGLNLNLPHWQADSLPQGPPYVSQLLYLFIFQWTSRLLPCPSYCK